MLHHDTGVDPGRTPSPRRLVSFLNLGRRAGGGVPEVKLLVVMMRESRLVEPDERPEDDGGGAAAARSIGTIECETKNAPAENRTRGPTMATLDFTTKPLALIVFRYGDSNPGILRERQVC
jgi:hypothetical protein